MPQSDSINLANAADLNIIQYAGCAIEFELLHFEDDDTTPKVLEGEFLGIVSKDEAGDKPVILFSPTVEDNKLTINLEPTTTKVEPRVYFLGIKPTDAKYLAYIGTLEILPNPAKGPQ